MQGPGDGSAVFTLPGKATPLPSPLHPVPTGATHMPERLHQVHGVKMSSVKVEQYKILELSYFGCCYIVIWPKCF